MFYGRASARKRGMGYLGKAFVFVLLVCAAVAFTFWDWKGAFYDRSPAGVSGLLLLACCEFIEMYGVFVMENMLVGYLMILLLLS